jgi:hypothetical protein
MKKLGLRFKDVAHKLKKNTDSIIRNVSTERISLRKEIDLCLTNLEGKK